jgi:hypothetical protein
MSPKPGVNGNPATPVASKAKRVPPGQGHPQPVDQRGSPANLEESHKLKMSGNGFTPIAKAPPPPSTGESRPPNVTVPSHKASEPVRNKVPTGRPSPLGDGAPNPSPGSPGNVSLRYLMIKTQLMKAYKFRFTPATQAEGRR